MTTDREQPRSSEGMRRGTGRDRAEWFAVLDDWGAGGRPYGEIADWLKGEHGLSNWWAQKLIVEYEQARGLREPGVRRGGTFEVSASKTVAVPIERLIAAFTDEIQRERWLPGAAMHEDASSSSQDTHRFDWETGPSRVVVSFQAAAGKSQVVVQHQRLTDAATAERTKAYWRERLAALKDLLES